MASREAKPSARKIGRQPSILKGQGKRPKGIKKERPQLSYRKSARLQDTRSRKEQTVTEGRNTEQKHQLPSPTSNTSGEENLLGPTQAKHRKRKRLQAFEDPRAPATHPPKRLRTIPPRAALTDTLGQTTAKDIETKESVQSWINGTPDPKELPRLEEKGSMNPLLAKKRSTSSLRSRQSEGGSARSAVYAHASYGEALGLKGSFMDESALGISDESRKLCQTLLDRDQTVPQDSLFRDDLFKKTCRKLKDQNEARIVQDIARLIVPSVETLATYGASHLNDLVESVNEAWAFAIPFLGPRPQSDYAVGFGRSAFAGDRLEKLFALTGKIQDTSASYYRNTWRMYFSFLTCEVKSGTASLDTADRQNAHSATVIVRAFVEIFRLVKREKELDGKIVSFSFSHDPNTVRIYAHYAAINGSKTTFHRHTIRKFDFTELDGKEKWVPYKITISIYEYGKRVLLPMICSVIDQLPPAPDLKSGVVQQPEAQVLEGSGLSQSLHSHHLSYVDSTVGDDDSQSSYASASEDTPTRSMSHGAGRESRRRKRRQHDRE